MQDSSSPTPQWTPSARELDDLDLLVNGCFEPPLSGFVDPTSKGAAPVTLLAPPHTAEMAAALGRLDLLDPEGAPLARMNVSGTWSPDDDSLGRVGLVGSVEQLGRNEFGPFRRLHRSPSDVHATQPASSLTAVPVSRALTSGDLAVISAHADDTGRTPLLLACVGEGMPQGISGPALVRVALAAGELLGVSSTVVAVAVADHGDQPVPPSTISPNQWLVERVTAAYATSTLMLDAKPTGELPAGIAAIVDQDRPPRDRQGVVIFFTGLSGSGKSTLARGLVDRILERGQRTVTSLDGDVVRHHLSKGLGFSREDRETNIARIGFVAAEISRHGGVAICSPIAPFEATREHVRQMVERAGGGFVLVHVATPLEECERRDRKGLYARARAGEIPDFTGISSPYEEPRDAVKLDTTDRDIAQCLDELVGVLTEQGWLCP
ncbi:MAG: adenylyl-sulfate kinase [Nocardioidaceae bacterium]